MNLRLPLVVILGATGSGKTKLSLELAQKFNAEIIGADSMQIYKGLDIITAKATPAEQKLAPHHLLDVLDPHEIFTVLDYRNKALDIINSLLSRNKIPIIVGGTNYYVESLLWKILVEEPGTSRAAIPGVGSHNEHEPPSAELHKRLETLDPAMAKRLHPNNKRKILRSLEVLQQKGKRHSEILREQQNASGSKSGGGLRFPNALIFWLQCEQATLDDRLNKRVDSMVAEGLVDELKRFHKVHNEERIKRDMTPDYTKGVYQSIGFKEFHKYLLLDPSEQATDEGTKLLHEGMEELKMVTRRYARKQFRWITNRFLARSDRQIPPLYGLSTDDVEKWNENVTVPAIEIIESYMNDVTCKHQPIPRKNADSYPNVDDVTYHCDTCDRIFIGEFQWNIHEKSNRHKRSLQRKRKLVNDTRSS